MSKTHQSSKRSDSQAEKPADYEVGRGKPPMHTRFKPGQSGNPKGRPKGVCNFKTDVQATLKTPVKVTRDGKRRKLSTQEAALLRLREKALSGDARALDRLLSLAQTHNNEEPVAAASMSADDAVVFEVFKARVLSGAIGSSAPAQVNDAAAVSGSSSGFGARSADTPGDDPKIHTDNVDEGERQ